MALDVIQQIYDLLDKLNLTPTTLLIAALIFLVSLLLAVREATTWFFKIDDLKKDLNRLHRCVVQLESEIKLLQNLEARAAQGPIAQIATPPVTEAAAPTADEPKRLRETKSKEKPSAFPISH